jgi:secreted trypsin-like serine protease
MKTKNALALILGLMNALPAYAVVTDHPLPTKNSAPQVCYLKFRNPENSSNLLVAASGCTGTLIRNNRLLTAAHCMDNIQKGYLLEVICNNGKRDYEAIGWEKDPAYAQTVTSDGNTTSDQHDVAIFDLKIPKKNAVTPIAIVSDQNTIQTILNDPSKCSLYGYGRTDNSVDQSWGNLSIGPVDYLNAAALATVAPWETDVADEDIFIGPTTHAAPGDSGGPILCAQADGTLVQIATTMEESSPISGPKIYVSRHEMTSFNADWINPTADKPVLSNKL